MEKQGGGRDRGQKSRAMANPLPLTSYLSPLK